jgi:hypothetical protein
MLNVIATYYLSAGDAAKAQPVLARSIELARGSPDTALRAELLCGNALGASMQGRSADAQAQIRKALALTTDDVATPKRCTDIAAKLAGR